MQTEEIIKITDLVRDEGDYFRRQPRVDPASLSYNYEQFRRYTKNLTVAKTKDDFESQRFYKMLAYIKKNIDNKKDPQVYNFVVLGGHDPSLIEVPEEFKDLEPAPGEEHSGFGRKSRRRPEISTRHNVNLAKYDVWRCSDRTVLKADGKQHTMKKLMIAPADLVKLFGMPDASEIFMEGSGQYTFEDNNLDMFCIFDYKQTDMYHGPNRDDDFYTTEKNLKKGLHSRKQKYPTIEEFWTSKELQPLKLAIDDQADHRKFRKWLRRQLTAITDQTKSHKEINEPKFSHEVGISHGVWDEKAVFCHEMAAFNYDWTYHMTEEELKAYKEELPEKLVIPKMFDLKKAERVFTNKDEIKLAEMEKEANKLQNL